MLTGLPRLVASDLDGTLLDPEGEVSVRTRRALDAVIARGIDVVLVTGRPPRWEWRRTSAAMPSNMRRLMRLCTGAWRRWVSPTTPTTW